MTAMHTCVHAISAEYVVELDAKDVDPALVRAVAVPGGVEIHIPRVPPEGEELRFLHPEAEPV